MTKNLLILLLLITIQFSCKENTHTKKQYYPVYAFLQQELNTIDSLPVAVIRIQEEDNKIDTAIITKADFRKIADGLIGNDVKNAEAINEYTETVYEDLDLKDITITYTTDQKSVAISKIEIHVDPITALVKSFYAERTDQMNATQIVRKILWTRGKQLLISSTHYSKSEVPKNMVTRFNW